MERIDLTTRVELNKPLAAEVIKAALAWRPEELRTPEFRFFDVAAQYAIETDNPKFLANAIFFITNNLYADNTTRQVERISDPEHLRKYAWLFDPQEISRRIDPNDPTTYDQVHYAVIDFLRPGRYHGNRSAHNWIHNAQVLSRVFDGDLEVFFRKFDYDLGQIQPMLQGPDSKKNWPLFKGFGAKTSRLTLQSMTAYPIMPLKNARKIGVPVDTQIASAMIQTGAVKLVNGEARKNLVLDRTLVPYFLEFCDENDIDPRLVSEAMYLLMHHLCNKLRHDICPIAKWCTTKLDRYHLDEDGMFRYPDPERDLRWQTRRTRIAALNGGKVNLQEKAKVA
jgi:hypothetical protein